MDSDTETFGNSTSKEQLKLQLDQPTGYADDINNLDDEYDAEDDNDDDEELKDGIDDEGERKTLTSNKDGIPAIYQVEPGCTALSCYSAIITFIVMSMGVFWLLLTSPPKTSLPVTIPPGERKEYLYDFEEVYDVNYELSSTSSPYLQSTPIETVVASAVATAKNLLMDDTGT